MKNLFRNTEAVSRPKTYLFPVNYYALKVAPWDLNGQLLGMN